jgi:hypothetical protein
MKTKRYYYQVSVPKLDSTQSLAELAALAIAQRRKRFPQMGNWTVKRIGQTPKRWVFRVKFETT